MCDRLRDRVAVITGAGSGIGLAAAHRLAAEGAHVVAVDIDEPAGEAAAAAVDGLFVRADVASEADVEAAFATVFARYGAIDVSFHNAGISPPDDDSILTTSTEMWQRVQDVNLRSVYLCCKHVIPYMQRQARGSIINVASFVAVLGSATSQISYTASKGGVLAMSRELGVQFAREGIRVNALCPGPGAHADARRAVRERPRASRPPLGAHSHRAVRRARGDCGGGRVPRQRRRVVRHCVDVPRRRRHLRGVRHAGMSADLDAFFRPSSIAVVGVSRDPASYSRRLLGFLRRFGYPGFVVGVNPNLEEVDGVRCVPTLHDVGQPVELVLVFTPASRVVDVITDAANTGARATIVYSSGFAEVGAEGRRAPRRHPGHRRRRGDAGARSQLSGRHPRAGEDDRQLLQRGRRARPASRRPGRLRRSERRRRWRHVRSAARARV